MSNAIEMREEMSDRFLSFAADIIKLGKQMDKSFEGRHVFEQLFRSGSSAGANYEESHSAQSTRDFIHKRELSLKELRESLFWLRLVNKSELAATNAELPLLLQENRELIKILAKAISSTKNNVVK